MAGRYREVVTSCHSKQSDGLDRISQKSDYILKPDRKREVLTGYLPQSQSDGLIQF